MAGRRTFAVRLATVFTAFAGFLFAVQLLSSATGALEPQLRTLLGRVVDGDVAALGSGWVAAYLLLNGSVVAAVSLALFGAGLVSNTQLVLLVAGSRLGAAGVVFLVGALDHLRNPVSTARESMRLGSLSFLATFSVYLPATLVSYLAVPWVGTPLTPSGGVGTGSLGTGSVFGPPVAWLLDAVGPPLAFLLALALLFGCLWLFDRLFRALDATTLRTQYLARLERPGVSFLAGVLLTALTTSVAFSLGIVVPLYNRELITRAEILPFILGASVGTLSDTLLVAVVLGTPGGVAAVVLLLVTGTLCSALALAAYGSYAEALGRVQDRILADGTTFAVFVAALLAVPLALAAF